MKFTQIIPTLFLASSAAAQTFQYFTDANGIKFWQATFSTAIGADGNAQWGMALPPAKETGLAEEYIGRLVVPRTSTGTWMGLSHMSEMTGALLLLSWIDGEDVMTSFRYASGYVAPDIYTGNATLSPISHSINDTHYELTYRCEHCWSWSQDGVPGSQIPATTSGAAQIVGWAQATNAPANPSESDSSIQQHANDGLFGAVVASARNADYTSWASLATPPPATATASGNGTAATATGALTTATAAPVACPSKNALANTTWDYIIVGAGAGGIPLADKLSEAGKSVLLIERGPPSSGRWGGSMKPDWLNGTNLTRFDVPGLDNEIWANSEGIACEDYSVMAGCVLGGGTAVNAGLWWRANPQDFDYNFPTGWKSSDMQPAIARVFDRIPYTDRPSTDGILYKPQGYDIVAGALAAAGWENVTADLAPGSKNMTFSHPNEMFSHGERGGPMATYLVTAHARKNFKLIMNTAVDRVVRDGSHVTGVELSAFLAGGYCGTVNVTPKTGRVILSAGAFGTPKILMRSGIGPQDQLQIVKGAEGSKMVSSADWVNLPVGMNLDDHVNTDIVITHPNVSFYDFYAAYNTPITSDKERYLTNRTGVLTQSAPNLSVVFWQEITGADGIVRQLQWTARVEASDGVNSTKAMTISQYLGRGAVSRGRTTITAALDMTVSTVPYLHNADDLAAVATGIDNMIASLKTDPKIEVVFGPSANQTTAEFLAAYPVTTGKRSANHWMGSCKMGLDSGLKNNGSSVVDTNTKVYGMDNLFVVDASVFPGMTSTNPSALIVAVAERASEKLLALPAIYNHSIPTNSTKVAPSGTTPCTQNITLTRSIKPTGTAYSSSLAGALSGSAPCTQNITLTRSFHPTAPLTTAKCTKTMTITKTRSSAATPTTTVSSEGNAISASSSSKCTKNITITRSGSSSASTVQPVSFSSPSAGYTVSSSAAAVAAPTASSAAPVPSGGSGAPIAEWQRCGGIGYTGTTTCVSGMECRDWNPYYSQCIPIGSN